jgi:integral membrane sensor domain MASE1
LTLWGDGRISRADALRTAAIWWATDALAIITFTPFLTYRKNKNRFPKSFDRLEFPAL